MTKRTLSLLLLAVVCLTLTLFACTQGELPVETTADTTPPANETLSDETNPMETINDTSAENTTPSAEETTPAETDAPKPTAVALYQLAPEANSLMQSYVIKTSNGKLIVIDGGIDGEGKDRDPYMPAALRTIAGVGQDGYFEVEAWFLSHAHKDHMYELSKMMAAYSQDANYKINNIYFDFPEFGSDEYPAENADMDIAKLKENMNKYGEVIGAQVKEGSTYYDDLNGAVINTKAIADGLSFEIDGVRIEILQTWDPADGTSNLNDTSLVLRMFIGEQSVLFLNDLGSIGGRRLLATYGDQLKSDIVQMAHHGQGGVTKEVYAAIGAQVHLWPTPIWVWKNASQIYQIDEVRTWLYGENFLKADEHNIVAGLYTAYPSNPTLVRTWGRAIDKMKIEFPYVVPERPVIIPEETTREEIVPVEHDYVEEGLIAYYSGTQNTRDGHNKTSTVWEDLVGGHDMAIVQNDANYFTDNGLQASSEIHKFPQPVVDVVNGQAFTIELLLGDFTSIGKDFNTFTSSHNDHFALFRRNSENVLELKTVTTSGTSNGRIKIPNGLELLQNALVTVVYKQNDTCYIYINGELCGQVQTANGSLGVEDFFIGHSQDTKLFDTTYRSIRFYNRALTAEEVQANATVDGFGESDKTP